MVAQMPRTSPSVSSCRASSAETQSRGACLHSHLVPGPCQQACCWALVQISAAAKAEHRQHGTRPDYYCEKWLLRKAFEMPGADRYLPDEVGI